ncbi:neprilysin-4 [Stomoxys calcitrans]|uniref:neprilysin-4 n=1 Tax=Stomoxys calcitrans TaxID=35570 RepID=UPI0027E2B915|nr:neprilysin-4 [Stomoxys calcitrans]
MSQNVFIFYACVALLRAIHSQGLPIAVAELNAQHTPSVIRQTKATEMLKYFNDSIDPCEDFFEFTCGNFAKYHPTNTTLNTFEILEDAMFDKIKNEMHVEDSDDTDVDKNIKSFYRSCILAWDWVGSYKQKFQDLIEEFGQMPVLEGENWRESDFDWSSAVAKIIYKTGLQIFFKIGATGDLNDNSISRVAFVQPPFAFKDISLYVDESLSIAKQIRLQSIARELGVFMDARRGLNTKTAHEILDFETSLARGMFDNKLNVNLSEIYRLVPIDTVQDKYSPVWDTKKLVTEALGFTPDLLLIQPGYLDNTFEVMQKASPKTVANFLFYQYLANFMDDIYDQQQEKNCIISTRNVFHQPLVNLIYRKYFNEHIKEGGNILWHELKTAFENTLKSDRLTWMSAETREYAIQKLKAINLELVTYEHNNFSQEFGGMDINDFDYIHNMKSILKRQGELARAKFDKSPPPIMPGGVSPINVIIENVIKVPIGILQPNYIWSSSYPYAYNFGTLGFVVAHEIFHGFFGVGRLCDIKGNLLNWWDTESETHFRQHARCFVDQYKSYSYGGRPLPELANQDENIADNGGLHLAYEAYLSWCEKHQDAEESFPGLEYNNRQLFFISFGQLMCATSLPDIRAELAASDVHVPEKFRVIGPLSNFDEFAKEFECSIGSAMHPAKKCGIY